MVRKKPIKQAIILHGCPERENYYDPQKPSESNAHWLPWLQRELIIRDIAAVTPEIPHAYDPDWPTWCREVERYDINAHTALIGHSAGGGFWLKYISEHPQLQVHKVILVAPWFDPNDTIRAHFFDFTPRPDLVHQTAGITVYYADDDSASVQTTLARINQQLNGVHFRKFARGYGHFTYENFQGGVAFPELRDDILT